MGVEGPAHTTVRFNGLNVAARRSVSRRTHPLLERQVLRAEQEEKTCRRLREEEGGADSTCPGSGTGLDLRLTSRVPAGCVMPHLSNIISEM